jgi:hypothetical protein
LSEPYGYVSFGILNEDREFFASDTPSHSLLGQMVKQLAAKLSNDEVTDVVAKGVVYGLEVIKIA